MTGQLFTAGARSVRLLSAETPLDPRPRTANGLSPRPAHPSRSSSSQTARPACIFATPANSAKCGSSRAGGANPRLDKLGVDALVATGDVLHAAARRRSVPIKSLLLEQSVIAGIGNIYADEALYFARVRPTRVSRSVDATECEAIVRAARRVLERAHQKGRLLDRRLRAPRRFRRLLPNRAQSLRARRRALPPLPHTDPSRRHRPTLSSLLPRVPGRALDFWATAGSPRNAPYSRRSTPRLLRVRAR